MKQRRLLFTLCAVAVVLALAVACSPWASSAPDGLEKIAQDLGLVAGNSASPAWKASPASDYQVPGVGNERTSTRLAGLLGTALAFAGGIGLGRVLMRRRRSTSRQANGRAVQPDPQS